MGCDHGGLVSEHVEQHHPYPPLPRFQWNPQNHHSAASEVKLTLSDLLLGHWKRVARTVCYNKKGWRGPSNLEHNLY